MLLKSSPKKGIHPDHIPLSLGMSGQFCTNRISINPGIRASLFSLELKGWSTKSSSYRLFRSSRYATNRSENVCSRRSVSIIDSLGNAKKFAVRHCGCRPHASRLSSQATFSDKLSLAQYAQGCFLAAGQMYLASPLTVAASAVAGYIVEYEPSNANDLVSAQRSRCTIAL